VAGKAIATIKIDNNLEQASKDLKKFGTVSVSERKRIQKFQEAFKGQQIDKFIDKNRRLGAAVRATSSPIESIIAQQKALERQTQNLIKKGLDPQDESVRRLTTEYDRLTQELKKNETQQKANELAVKGATVALQAIAAAAAAATAAAIASTIAIGKQGDQLAKTSAKIGVGVEALQELSFAAERSGLPANNLGGIFQKLNRNIGDLQAGTGTLTTFLKKSDEALLEQLKTTTDSEEAFNILIDAIAKAPTQFDKAALSQAAFGRSGQDIINFANQGSTEIARLRQEAADYGLISEEVARKGEEFVDSQRNLEQAATGLRAIFASGLLPIFTKFFNKLAEFIADTDQVKKVLETLLIALAGVTGGLVAFLAVTKGAAAIGALATAFKLLTAAIAANPLGVLAFVITAVLIPAIILLIKNWDKVSIFIQENVEILKERFALFGENVKTVWTLATNALIILFISLGKAIIDNVFNGLSKVIELATKIPFVGEKFEGVASQVDSLKESFDQAADGARNSLAEAIKTSFENRNQIAATTRENIANIRAEADARREELEKLKAENTASAEAQVQLVEETENKTTEIVTTKLKERLEGLNNAEAQARLESVAAFDEFLKARLDQEQIAGEERILFLQEELLRIQELENISNEERLAARIAVEQLITEETKKQNEERAKQLQDYKNTAFSVFGKINEIVNLSAANDKAAVESSFAKRKETIEKNVVDEEERKKALENLEKEKAKKIYDIELGLFNAQKVASVASIAINTAEAVTKAFAQLGPIGGPVAAGIIGAIGVAQAGLVVSQAPPPPPTAQTGTPLGGLTIPDSGRSSRADNVGVLASPGETVRVTPRGESPVESQRIIIRIEEKTIFDVVNRGIENGEIPITTDNIQGGIGA
jgi:hypothetical protein